MTKAPKPTPTDELDPLLRDFGVVFQWLRQNSVDTMNQKAWLSLDLSMPQVRALFSIVRAGRLRSKELAALLGVGPPAVTAIVDKLARKKLLRREHDVDDRRVVWLVPTPQATALHERLVGAGRASLRALFASLSPRDLNQVKAGIAAMAAAVAQHEVKS